MRTQTLIIGGGLAGLALADALHHAGKDFQLIEARNRLGGRVHMLPVGGTAFDLGPAWFWSHQPRMAAAAMRFGLKVFEQYCQGDIAAEDAQGRVQRGAGFASMAGSLRIDGGMGALIGAYADAIPADRIHLGQCASEVVQVRDGVQVHTADLVIEAKQVVLAIPPRLAAGLRFDPPAPVQTMADIPTWMAGHAKIVAVYDRPHWRDAGFSGDGQSRCGPMVEIHDASPANGGPYAVFGFVGFDAAQRAAHRGEILNLAKAQLVRLFGPQMASPISLVMQDWAQEPMTATLADHHSTSHPAYGQPPALQTVWNGALILGSSEMGAEHGGYLEGALEVAQDVVAVLMTVTEGP